MERTDKTLIAIALLLLLITIGLYLGFDQIFGDKKQARSNEIAFVLEGSGDVRVKFKDEFNWQKAAIHQKLIYDDAVFAGENSSMSLQMSSSTLKLDSNTLVVLRKEELFKGMDLYYGALQGLIAKGEHLSLRSGGERFELSSDQNAKVQVQRTVSGRLSIQVQSGRAHVIRQGKPIEITPSQPLVVEAPKRAPEPLQWLKPDHSSYYTHAESVGDRKKIPFQWSYVNRLQVDPKDLFVLEISDIENFSRIVAKEDLLGEARVEVSLPSPGHFFARVTNGFGDQTPVKVLELGPLRPPQVEFPRHQSEIDLGPGQTLAHETIRLVKVPPWSHSWLQVSTAADFGQTVLNRNLRIPETPFTLPAGAYYLRVRSISDEESLMSVWSEPIKFTVRDHLELPALARATLPERIWIANLKYPDSLYQAKDSATQDFLSAMPPLPKFFQEQWRNGFELHVALHGQPESDRILSEPQFPKEWIYPGKLDFDYSVQTQGQIHFQSTHRVSIELEAPKSLMATKEGDLSWSPLLFAEKYELRAKDSSERPYRWIADQASYRPYDLRPGHKYTFRVRALGHDAKPISDWSKEKAFYIPAPPKLLPRNLPIEKPAPVPLAKVLEPEPERKVAAQTEPSGAIRLREPAPTSSFFHRLGAWLWGGAGYNFVLVRQTINNTADVEYKNTKGPSQFVEAGFLDLGGVGAVVSFKQTPGDIRVDNYPVNERSFVWDTTSAEGLWRLPWRPRLFDRSILWGFRAGLQYHKFPFLYVDSDRSLVQAHNHMTTASLGFFSETSGRWKYLWSMRYQQPIQSGTEGGNQFSISPTVAFDGSIGTSYDLSDHWRTGLFWYGQLHDYRFTYTSATQTNVGEQSLFYSNVEMRLGYDF